MSESVRVLFSNLWFPVKTGVVKGCIFIEKGRIGFIGEHPEPEHELSELQYDFQGYAMALHGFSTVVDVVEYPLRRLRVGDLSVLSRDELKTVAEVGLINAVSNGITMPIIHSDHSEAAVEAARELGVPLIVIHGGEARVHGGIHSFTLRNGRLYVDDKPLGPLDDVLCSPLSTRSTCRIMDLRSAGSTPQPLAILHSAGVDAVRLYRILTEPYRLIGAGEGYVDRGETADLQVVDLRNPVKASIIRGEEDFWSTASRFTSPDLVLIHGEVVYEKGEYLIKPLRSITGILGKLANRLSP